MKEDWGRSPEVFIPLEQATVLLRFLLAEVVILVLQGDWDTPPEVTSPLNQITDLLT
jgi:hypothetical protein